MTTGSTEPQLWEVREVYPMTTGNKNAHSQGGDSRKIKKNHSKNTSSNETFH
jgi:hypothetical protein